MTTDDSVSSVMNPQLAAALAKDDAAEEAGMHGDDRSTCWQCQSWADHAHIPYTGHRITLEEYSAIQARRGF